MKPMRILLAVAALCGATAAAAQSAATSNNPTGAMSATTPGSPGTVPAQSQIVGQADTRGAANRSTADTELNAT